jgi:glycosyltransferase involved in cell wall biosynthesis
MIRTISVLICTWNRAKLLDQTLTQMRQLRMPAGVEWELLVVNNNCTDDTDAVLQRHSEFLPLRRLLEKRQGQCHARNCAIAAARGDLLLWTDDDVLVGPDWLEQYAAAGSRWPEAAFFVGAIDPWFEKAPPAWIRRHFARLRGVYCVADNGVQERLYRSGEAAFGANMAFRAAVARRFPFNPLLGHSRGELVGGDDSEMIERVLAAGEHGVWLPAPRVRHFVPAQRLTLAYVWKWFRCAGRNIVLHNGTAGCATLAGMPRWALKRCAAEFVKTCLFAPTRGKRWFDAFASTARMYGILQESRRFRVPSQTPAVAQ